ncbi:DUF1643 domain-containing protein [Rhizobium sp. BK399]|uniref:DUF1643 domain-containing protein n=1 Tax=Rhizobium sp. BK399 TaxID=2587063 RepID=UPI001613BD35|nr:DUF1643 domain-containing protein [Rhizobium sp. BK399]MBB3541128.1 hypothetical protein [Rhizobium sp. BK399]
MSDNFIVSSAVFSRCGCYRYRLERQWDPLKKTVAFLMLNPSTANARDDDPTLRRCITFARSWGFGGLVVGNLFALRSTSPSLIYEHTDPVGPANDRYLRRIGRDYSQIVCAWGRHGAYLGRGSRVFEMLRSSRCCALKLTSNGHPSHPLYISATADPKPFWI